METIETETKSESNGTSPPPAVKPWIAAGFKSRDAWRASKGHKTAKKTAVKTEAAAAPAKPKAAKKPKKPKAKVKAASAKPKAKKPKKAKKPSKKLAAKSQAKKVKAKKKGPGVKDGSADVVALADLKPRMKKVFLAVKKGATATLEEIQAKAFGNLSHAKGSSWTRNQLRFLRIHKMFKKLGDGKYKRVA